MIFGASQPLGEAYGEEYRGHPNDGVPGSARLAYPLPYSAVPSVIPGQVAHAATLTVTNNNNSGPGSLRQAIADANSGDTITFDPGILPGTITLTSGSYLIVDKDLTIDGPGASDLAIDGNNASRVFLISGGTVAISDVTIQNGSVSETAAESRTSTVH